MKYLMLISLSLLLFSCGSGSEKVNDPTQKEIEYTKYVNNENKFRLEYPSHWEKIEDITESYVVVALTENNPDTNDVFDVGLNIIKLPNEGKTLVEIIQKNLEMLKEQRPDYELGVKNLKNSNGIDMVLITADMIERETKLTTYSVFFIHGPDLFNMTLAAETKEIDEYLDFFDRILNSLEWIE